MRNEAVLRYGNEEVTVLWKPALCIHSGICARGLPRVFRPRERPWIAVDAATAEEIVAQVALCPSGALSIATAGRQDPRSADADEEKESS